jgi:hypothetical protein
VDQLRQHAPPGTASPERLAEALGSSTELLRKAGRFAVLYDKRGDVQKLERMKVTWTQLYFSFAVPRRQDRHKLLREAVTNNWTDKDLRLRVQEHIGSKRGGMGGRPTRTPERFGPEMTLWELERLSRKWTVLLEEARSSFRGSEWKKFARSASKDERLGELLLKVESAVKAVAKGCNEIRQVLHTVS